MNWTVGFKHLRHVGMVLTLVGVLCIAFGWLEQVVPTGLAFLTHLPFGTPLIFYGVLFWVLSWVGEGFTTGSRSSR